MRREIGTAEYAECCRWKVQGLRLYWMRSSKPSSRIGMEGEWGGNWNVPSCNLITLFALNFSSIHRIGVPQNTGLQIFNFRLPEAWWYPPAFSGTTALYIHLHVYCCLNSLALLPDYNIVRYTCILRGYLWKNKLLVKSSQERKTTLYVTTHVRTAHKDWHFDLVFHVNHLGKEVTQDWGMYMCV